jgi:uncharacterized membrane protein
MSTADQERSGKMSTSTIEKAVEVNVPVRTAYNQWTQFETFPQFMEGVEDVRQVTDTQLHWRTKIMGVTREFDAEITDQEPDRRVSWHTTEGPAQGGTVTFQPVNPGTTRVALAMEFEPEGMAEKIADATNMVERRVEADLRRFKEFIEEHGTETGAWRGSV